MIWTILSTFLFEALKMFYPSCLVNYAEKCLLMLISAAKISALEVARVRNKSKNNTFSCWYKKNGVASPNHHDCKLHNTWGGLAYWAYVIQFTNKSE